MVGGACFISGGSGDAAFPPTLALPKARSLRPWPLDLRSHELRRNPTTALEAVNPVLHFRSCLFTLQFTAVLAAPASLVAATVPVSPPAVRLAHYDFGLITLGREVRHEFQLVNTSAVSVSVKLVAASCDCLQVTSVSSNIPAGAAGRLAVVVRPKIAGFVDYSVAFQTVPGGGTKMFTLSGKAVTGEAGPPKTNLLVSAGELLASKAAGDALCLVDVRGQAGYRLARIPGSLNLPLFTVKTRSFLRSKRVILVNEGCEHDGLLAECDRLAAAGFLAPRLLDGGVRAWQQAAGQLEGEDVVSSRLGTITPSQFYFGHADNLWLAARLRRLDPRHRRRGRRPSGLGETGAPRQPLYDLTFHRRRLLGDSEHRNHRHARPGRRGPSGNAV